MKHVIKYSRGTIIGKFALAIMVSATFVLRLNEFPSYPVIFVFLWASIASYDAIKTYFTSIIADDDIFIYLDSQPYKKKKYKKIDFKNVVIIKKLRTNFFLQNLDGTKNYEENWYLQDKKGNLIKIWIKDGFGNEAMFLFKNIFGEVVVQIQE